MSRPDWDVYPYRLPLREGYRWARGVQWERQGVLVRCRIGRAVGWGECVTAPDIPVDGPTYAAEIEPFVEAVSPGDDSALDRLDRQQPDPGIRCGITSALLAARAAAVGRPLGDFLCDAYLGGAWTASTSVIINGIVTGATPDEVTADVRQAVEQGLRTVKIKCSDQRDLDLARVAAARKAAPDAAIRLDANGSWHPDWVDHHLNDLSRYSIEYVEQPFPESTDLGAMAALRNRSPVPLALDQSVRSVDDVGAIVRAGAADLLILKPPQLGGPDRVAAAIGAAGAAGIRSVVTSSLESAVGIHTALHCASMLPVPQPACGLGMGRYLSRDVAASPVVQRGQMEVPRAPGLGIGEINVNALR